MCEVEGSRGVRRGLGVRGLQGSLKWRVLEVVLLGFGSGCLSSAPEHVAKRGLNNYLYYFGGLCRAL